MRLCEGPLGKVLNLKFYCDEGKKVLFSLCLCEGMPYVKYLSCTCEKYKILAALRGPYTLFYTV